LILSLASCGIDKSKQVDQLILTILAKLGPKYVVYVSTFHSGRYLMGTNWKMPTMDQFIDSLTHEQEKLIHMGLIKDPKAHALTMHDGKGSSKQKERRNKTRRRDIPNPSMILQVPKTLQIPRRRRRESNALTAINQIMKNPHA
jgi:hypothetical protein